MGVTTTLGVVWADVDRPLLTEVYRRWGDFFDVFFGVWRAAEGYNRQMRGQAVPSQV